MPSDQERVASERLVTEWDEAAEQVVTTKERVVESRVGANVIRRRTTRIEVLREPIAPPQKKPEEARDAALEITEPFEAIPPVAFELPPSQAIVDSPVDHAVDVRRKQETAPMGSQAYTSAAATGLDMHTLMPAPRPSELLQGAQEMDRATDAQCERNTAASILQRKIETGDFDVFLCYNSEDNPAVKKIGEQLKERGILPWLDEWELRPGLPWQRLLEQQIAQIKSAAVFVGKEGIGPWQHLELEAFLREFIERGCPVIPILLPDAPKKPKLPIFLKSMTWVDFGKQDPDPMEQLIWGITGKRSGLKK